MPSKKHIHTYERRQQPKGIESKQVYFRCVDPDCSHRILREDLFGKRANCPFCGEAYILDPRMLRLKLPHCGCRSLDQEQLSNIKLKLDPKELLENMLKLKQEKFNDGTE
jgi:hypothetical protein